MANLANLAIPVSAQPNLNWLLLIFRALILCSSVDGGTRSHSSFFDAHIVKLYARELARMLDEPASDERKIA